MNKIKLVTVYLFVSFLSYSQENNEPNSENLKNSVFVEALGNGLFGSINYERQLTKEPGLSLRAGIGFYTEDEFYLTFPTSIQYLIALRNSNFIETGIGYTWADSGADDIFNDETSNSSENLNNLFLSVGYRKHFGNDWMWKANFTPLITNNKDVTLPWIGVSIGKRF